MQKECSAEPMLFARLERRDLVADFGGGAITSDAGAPLLWRWPRAAACGWQPERRRGAEAGAEGRCAAPCGHREERRAGTRRTSQAVVADIRPGGATSLRAIAAELNPRDMRTGRGAGWHVSTVMNLLDRLGLREVACASAG